MKSYFIFNSMTHVMQAEKICSNHGIKVTLETAPRKISSDCGICLTCDEKTEKAIENLMYESMLEFRLQRI